MDNEVGGLKSEVRVEYLTSDFWLPTSCLPNNSNLKSITASRLLFYISKVNLLKNE